MALSLAAGLDWDTLRAKPDMRRDYGELRMVGYALKDDRLYCVVFVDRAAEAATELRIISLRKANNREKASYGSRTSDTC